MNTMTLKSATEKLVNVKPVGDSISFAGIFLAPWVLCSTARNKTVQNFLFKHADIVGRALLLKNKHLHPDIIHNIIVDNSIPLSVPEYQSLSMHPNVSVEDVTYLLRDKETNFSVRLGSPKYLDALHVLRDSGNVKDYNLYCYYILGAITLNSLNLSRVEAKDISIIAELGSESGIIGDYKAAVFIDAFLETNNPNDECLLAVIDSKLPIHQKDTAFYILSRRDSFELKDMPVAWQRQALGLPSECSLSEEDLEKLV